MNYLSQSFRNSDLEIKNRILNNLLYMYKSKGTINSLRMLMACYGVPEHMLKIREFGNSHAAIKNFSREKVTYYKHYLYGQNTSQNIDFYLSGITDVHQYTMLFKPELMEHGDIFTYTNSDGDLMYTLSCHKENGNYISFKNTITDVDTSTTVQKISSHIKWYEGITILIEINQPEDGNVNFSYRYLDQLTQDVEYISDSGVIASSGGNGLMDGAHVIINLSPHYGLAELRLFAGICNFETLNKHIMFQDSILCEGYFNKDTTALLDRYSLDKPQDLHLTSSIFNDSTNSDYAGEVAIANNFTSSMSYPYGYQLKPYTAFIDYPNTSIAQLSSDNIQIVSTNNDINTLTQLSYDSSITDFSNSITSLPYLGIYLSPTDFINENIIKNLAISNYDDLLADPADYYSDSYYALDEIRKLYINNFNTIDIKEFIDYINNLDPTMYSALTQFIPSRVIPLFGLLFEQSMVERTKPKHIKPTAQLLDNFVVLDTKPKNNIGYNINDSFGLIRTSINVQSASYNDISNMLPIGLNINSSFDVGNDVKTTIKINEINNTQYLFINGFISNVLSASIDDTQYFSTSADFMNIGSMYVDIDTNAIIFNDIRRYAENQTYTTSYPSKHIISNNFYLEGDKRMRFTGCLNDASTSYNGQSPIIVNDTYDTQLPLIN
jgi:hypothetical protein